MIKRMFRKIICTNPKTLESVMALQSIIWGFWLLIPYRTFESSPAYSVMAVLANEEVWGAYFLALGAIQLLSMHFFTRKHRTMVSGVMMFSWIFVDFGFWASGSTSAAAVTYMTFVIVSIWSFVVLSAPDKVYGCEN